MIGEAERGVGHKRAACGANPASRSRREGVLAGLAVMAGAAVTLGASYRRFDWQTGEDERYTARTTDGWTVALYRYRARCSDVRKACPIVCCHGMAGTRLIYDLHPDYSLARYLAGDGFDVWLVDLRGRGRSWPAGGPDRRLQWSFDDFVERDFPAVVARVVELTGAPQLFWVGMEMSGQMLYAAAIRGHTERVRGAVTCGAPVLTPASAQVPGVTAPPKLRWRGRVPFRAGARAAGPILAYARSAQLESSFRACNVDPLIPARYFRNGIPDEATALVDQFAAWVREGVMRNLDGSVVYSQRLREVTLPLLMIAAARDLQRPPQAVRAAHDAFASQDKTLVSAGVRDGFRVDYGHDDLLAGLAAPAEIFPLIARWLTDRSGP